MHKRHLLSNAQGRGRGVPATWDAPNEARGERVARQQNAYGLSEWPRWSDFAKTVTSFDYLKRWPLNL